MKGERVIAIQARAGEERWAGGKREMSNKSGMEEWERVWSRSVGCGREPAHGKQRPKKGKGRSRSSSQRCAASTSAKVE